MKRLLDIFISLLFLILFFIPLFIICIIVFLQDRHSPFYVPERVGKDNVSFKMIKIRSMSIDADKSKVDSTSANDPRITKVGIFIRRYKIDEISQLFNVLIGNMSLVGPRPNIKRETDLYSEEERKILSVKPGITDLSSIVFSDEGDILADKEDPDIAYNQLIRPWKSRLALVYVSKRNMILDIQILFLTLLNMIDRTKALSIIFEIVSKINGNERLLSVINRDERLIPYPPPGFDHIVESRDII